MLLPKLLEILFIILVVEITQHKEKTTYVYDVINDSWGTTIDMLVKSIRHSSVLYNNKIYIIGGQNDTGSPWNTLDKIQVYTPASSYYIHTKN